MQPLNSVPLSDTILRGTPNTEKTRSWRAQATDSADLSLMGIKNENRENQHVTERIAVAPDSVLPKPEQRSMPTVSHGLLHANGRSSARLWLSVALVRAQRGQARQ